MPVLSVTKHRLNPGLSQTDPSLLKILPTLRSLAKTPIHFYAAIEDPSALLILSTWPSPSAHVSFTTTSQALLAPLSSQEWTEYMPLDTKTVSNLPLTAPILTISRAFLKPLPHPHQYFSKISALKTPIEEETAPYPSQEQDHSTIYKTRGRQTTYSEHPVYPTKPGRNEEQLGSPKNNPGRVIV
ncbi:hypothetical protein EG327_007337 [Venturia inaequalis]|uniref:ABM domain-containing protein n=1 Tax=Venturia inaequalis TaxID=5025 RepID=A0A8H3V024_VENIN|nr:hypothetical protein EG327_007337 [Venturia inaequalis]